MPDAVSWLGLSKNQTIMSIREDLSMLSLLKFKKSGNEIFSERRQLYRKTLRIEDLTTIVTDIYNQPANTIIIGQNLRERSLTTVFMLISYPHHNIHLQQQTITAISMIWWPWFSKIKRICNKKLWLYDLNGLEKKDLKNILLTKILNLIKLQFMTSTNQH